jgi:hypothetical protein
MLPPPSSIACNTGQPLRRIELHGQHSVQVVGLLLPLIYVVVIWLEANLHLYDAIMSLLLEES